MNNQHVYVYYRWCGFVAANYTGRLLRATFMYQWAEDEKTAQEESLKNKD